MIRPIQEKETQTQFHREGPQIRDEGYLERLLRNTAPRKLPELQSSLLKYVQPPPEKKKHTQNWAAYDMAKTNEVMLFITLLAELLATYIEEKPHKKGRRPIPLKDQIFCSSIKVFYGTNLRKCESILKASKFSNIIERVPCFKSIDNFMNNPRLSPILDELILITALPLSDTEETAGIDSTGFTTSRFERWNNFKWGKHEGKERVWTKGHAMVGCKSNIIISIEVTECRVSDISMLEKTVGEKTTFFNFKSFVADKAYSSRKVLTFLGDLGLIPHIPFKSNARGNAKTSPIWRAMFEHFKYKREEFDREYHKRSNLETTFHMVKQRFGDSVKTKTLTGNINEIKLKALCHNICVLIQESYESGIEIDFDSCVKIAQTV